jgi:hypothetical protein
MAHSRPRRSTSSMIPDTGTTRRLGSPEDAWICGLDRRPFHAARVQVGGTHRDQVRHYLYPQDPATGSREVSQQGRGPPRARPHV